jgi:hypothetical protein
MVFTAFGSILTANLEDVARNEFSKLLSQLFQVMHTIHTTRFIEDAGGYLSVPQSSICIRLYG